MKWLKEIINISDSMDFIKSRLKEIYELMLDYLNYIKTLIKELEELRAEVDKLKNECVKDDCK